MSQTKSTARPTKRAQAQESLLAQHVMGLAPKKLDAMPAGNLVFFARSDGTYVGLLLIQDGMSRDMCASTLETTRPMMKLLVKQLAQQRRQRAATDRLLARAQPKSAAPLGMEFEDEPPKKAAKKAAKKAKTR